MNGIKARVVRDLDELKQLAAAPKQASVFVLLNGGLRSSKIVEYNATGWGKGTWRTRTWRIFNEIDGTTQHLSEDALERMTSIPEALKVGALYLYED